MLLPYAGANVNSCIPFAVVLNTAAGRGLAQREWPRLAAELQARGLPYDLLKASSAQEALAQVQALAPGRPVLVGGGEGTVAAILPALIAGQHPLAVVPLGSGNDFAGMLGLKPGDFAQALDRLRFQPRQVDALEVRVVPGEHVDQVGHVGPGELVGHSEQAGLQKVLLNGLGMGFDAQLTDTMQYAPGFLTGIWRYSWGAAASVRHLELFQVKVEVDGQRLYHGPSAIAAVMNGTRYGGGFLISPRSDAQDGLLNVVWSVAVNRPQLIGLMARVLPGRHLGHPLARHARGREVRLRWSSPVFTHLDGDVCGRASEVVARVLPGAVCLLNG